MAMLLAATKLIVTAEVEKDFVFIGCFLFG